MTSVTPDQLLIWLQAAGFKLAAAAVTFIVGRWIARLLILGLRKAMRRAEADQTLTSFLGNVCYGLLMAIVAISALGQLGVSTTSAAALLGGAGIAIGLSLKDQLSAFAAGVMLILFRPFRTGDYVEAGGTGGTVEEIRIVATTLKTPNNQEVTVPNDRIWGSNIINYTIRGTRRIDLPLGISYDADLKRAKEILEQLVSEDARILTDPAPWIGITELSDSAVILTFRPWVATGDYWQTRSDLLERVKLAFDSAGVGIPYPQMDVHLEQQPAA